MITHQLLTPAATTYVALFISCSHAAVDVTAAAAVVFHDDPTFYKRFIDFL